MADLIIKPSTGGSLKLQEDGGTDAISINTSGVATLANATITAGTFPAGHVIKTVTACLAGQSGSITATSYTRRDDMTAQITNVKSGNKVNVRMNFNFYIDMGDTADGGSCCIYRENTIISSHTGGHQYYVSNADLAIYIDAVQDFTDASPAVGTNNYYLGMRAYSNCSVAMETGGKFNIILQEIQG